MIPTNHHPHPLRSRRRQNNSNQPPSSPNNEILEAYNTLGLERNATEREIRIIFRQLSRTYHLDRHQSEKNEITNNEAQELFQAFNNAQEILIEHIQTNHPTEH